MNRVEQFWEQPFNNYIHIEIATIQHPYYHLFGEPTCPEADNIWTAAIQSAITYNFLLYPKKVTNLHTWIQCNSNDTFYSLKKPEHFGENTFLLVCNGVVFVAEKNNYGEEAIHVVRPIRKSPLLIENEAHDNAHDFILHYMNQLIHAKA